MAAVLLALHWQCYCSGEAVGSVPLALAQAATGTGVASVTVTVAVPLLAVPLALACPCRRGSGFVVLFKLNDDVCTGPGIL